MRDLVAVGGVSVVLAQDRDRIAREPAYHYLLRREFEEHDRKYLSRSWELRGLMRCQCERKMKTRTTQMKNGTRY